MKKQQNTSSKHKKLHNSLWPAAFIVLLLVVWQLVCTLELVPPYMLPSPITVVKALITDAGLLLKHTLVTLEETAIGLFFAMLLSFVVAVAMDRIEFLRRSLYPLIFVIQTIPTVALAPLLVLWLGYGILPKIVLIFLTCFFPLTVGWLAGFAQADRDMIRLFESMGASRKDILLGVKIPCALGNFFAGLKIAVAYALVGAVVAEWLGGEAGLGVYMTRVRKSYDFDSMFAAIFVVSGLSLILMWVANRLHRFFTPWQHRHTDVE